MDFNSAIEGGVNMTEEDKLRCAGAHEVAEILKISGLLMLTPCLGM